VKIEITLDTIRDAAKLFWKSVGGKKVIAFHGSMGAGKTTFIHALCEVKGIKDIVGSPTFSIINEYQVLEKGEAGKLFHLDLYRIKDEDEAIQAGVEDCLYSGHICFIEWPEKAPGLLPADTIHVFIEPVSEHTRIITIPDI
jgi:tRNA threonylcarbamoyladenosine biosynthesis protein TsaE